MPSFELPPRLLRCRNCVTLHLDDRPVFGVPTTMSATIDHATLIAALTDFFRKVAPFIQQIPGTRVQQAPAIHRRLPIRRASSTLESCGRAEGPPVQPDSLQRGLNPGPGDLAVRVENAVDVRLKPFSVFR